MAMEELRNNKLRTFLSLFGITIGILCIIGVLTTVQSLERNIKDGLKDLGSNTIYVQKWPWGGGGEYPWWKYMKRPEPKYEELRPLEQRSNYASAVAFTLITRTNVEYKDDVLENVNWYGVTEDFHNIQEVTINDGRYLTESEFATGQPVLVMGHEIARKLFGEPQRALGKRCVMLGRTVTVVGVMKKAGQSLVGGWQFDDMVLMPFNFTRQLVDERRSDRFLVVRGKEGVSVDDLKIELQGIMRSVRKLRPTEEDNFALNDVSSSSAALETFFSNVNIGGFVIGGFSLIVGLFGIANIMFVTVKERTSQIGLKKAVGAKRSYILTEFLLESSFLCIVGGLIGLVLVFLLTLLANAFMPFKIALSAGIIMLAIGISVAVGLLAGFIPAWNASRLDPVVAIRS